MNQPYQAKLADISKDSKSNLLVTVLDTLSVSLYMNAILGFGSGSCGGFGPLWVIMITAPLNLCGLGRLGPAIAAEPLSCLLFTLGSLLEILSNVVF